MQSPSVLRSILSAATLAAGALAFTAPAQAAIIYTPGTIVDQGSYITDTVSNLDWYKFSNAVNTVGLTANSWQWATGLSGWAMASVAQVRGLQSRFGYTGDTLDANANANIGLTDAMGAFLGYTVQGSVVDGVQTPYNVSMIRGLTSDGGSVVDPVSNAVTVYHQRTTSETYWVDVNGVLGFYGDLVNGEQYWQQADESDIGTGIWLARASAIGGGGGALPECGRLTPCDASDVPEPGSVALVMLGIACIAQRRRARRPALA